MAKAAKNPLYPLVKQWLTLLDDAKKQKRERWGKYAEEMYKFYNGPHNFMWKNEYARAEGGFLDKEAAVPLPRFLMSIGKVSDAVDLFGPSLVHQYPEVIVEPIRRPQVDPMAFGLSPEDPNAQQQIQQMAMEIDSDWKTRKLIASHKQFYLNWLQVAAGKKDHARRAITEAIVKGLGFLYTELWQPLGSKVSYPRSRFISADNVIFDPDATNPDEIQWIAIEWTRPVNLVERKYNLPEGSLKPGLLSKAGQSTEAGRRDAKANRLNSYDLITYWEIYSKNGFGQRLKSSNKIDPELKEIVNSWGDFNLIVVAKGVNFPFNLHDDVIASGDDDLIFNAAQWPIPFWRDDGTSADWPVSMLKFREDPNDIYGVSLFKPAIGFIRFCNWAMSFLADKVSQNACDYVACDKHSAKELREQIASQSGPFKILELDLDTTMGRKLSEVIAMLDKPGFDTAIWNMVKECFVEIDKITGLSDLLYGQTGRAMRSAEEAGRLGDNAMIRPEEMANRTDDWYAQAALKECQAAQWLLEQDDIEPIMGKYGAAFWMQVIRVQDFDAIARDYSFKLAAGSARKPNRAGKMQSLTEIGQVIMPTIQALALNGSSDQWNWYVRQLGEQLEIDVDEALIQPPPPPDPNAPPPPPSPEEVAAQASQAKLQAEQQRLQVRIQLDQQRMAMEQQRLQLDQQRMQIEAQSQVKKLEIELQQAAAKLQAEQAKLQAGMQADVQKAQLDQQVAEQRLQMEQMRVALEQQKMELEAAKQQMMLENEQQKSGMKLDTEAQKHALNLDAESQREELRTESELNRQQLKTSADQQKHGVKSAADLAQLRTLLEKSKIETTAQLLKRKMDLEAATQQHDQSMAHASDEHAINALERSKQLQHDAYLAELQLSIAKSKMRDIQRKERGRQ